MKQQHLPGFAAAYKTNSLLAKKKLFFVARSLVKLFCANSEVPLSVLSIADVSVLRER